MPIKDMPTTLTTRPTYTRQISNDSRVEMNPIDPPVAETDRRGSIHFKDVFVGNRELPTTNRPDSPLKKQLLQVPDNVGSTVATFGQAAKAHWRDLTVGAALTGIVSWAIWATVKIHRGPDIPYCIFEEGKNI